MTGLLCIVRVHAQAEKHLRASNLSWTIVRPGGLSNEMVGNVIFGKEDTFLGLESDPGREISRQTVCLLCSAGFSPWLALITSIDPEHLAPALLLLCAYHD